MCFENGALRATALLPLFTDLDPGAARRPSSDCDLAHLALNVISRKFKSNSKMNRWPMKRGQDRGDHISVTCSLLWTSCRQETEYLLLFVLFHKQFTMNCSTYIYIYMYYYVHSPCLLNIIVVFIPLEENGLQLLISQQYDMHDMFLRGFMFTFCTQFLRGFILLIYVTEFYIYTYT